MAPVKTAKNTQKAKLKSKNLTSEAKHITDTVVKHCAKSNKTV